MSYRSYTGKVSYNFVNNLDEVITSMVLFIEVTTSTVYYIENTFLTYYMNLQKDKYFIMKTISFHLECLFIEL